MLSLLKTLTNLASTRRRTATPGPKIETERPTPSDWVSSWGDLEIRSKLGSGSFGEVYLAWDTRLQREIALKLVPSRHAPLDEARSIARLHHPNVIDIYKVDERDGLVGLQLELIKGETLENCLHEHGRLESGEAFAIGADICRALSAVHGEKLLHRDIKAQNVMREDGGRTVLMDFGLGQVQGRDNAEFAGTLPYMAPELFEGAPAAPQTDIYATGVLLFHLVSASFPVTALDEEGYRESHRRGQRLSLSDVRPDFPRSFVAVIERACAPEPAGRYSTAAEMLEAILQTSEARNRAHGLRRWAAVGVMAVLVLGAALAFSRWPDGSLPESRLALNPFTLNRGVTDDPTISEDGRMVAYVSDRDTKSGLELYVESTAHSGQPRRLTFDGTNKSEPSFSPDAEWVAFRSERDGGGIYVIPASGGTPHLVTEGGRTPRFSPDGTRIAYWTGDEGELPHVNGSIFVVGAKGGSPQQLATDYAGSRYPVWTTDGKHILFEGLKDPTLSWDKSSELEMLDLDTGRVFETGAQAALRARKLTPFAMASNFRGNSFLASARGEEATNLYRIDLSPRTWRLAGPPQQLTMGTNVFMSPWIARSGEIVAASLEGSLNIWRISEHRGSSSERPDEALPPSAYLNAFPSVSRDGRLLTYSKSLGRMRDIWLRNLVTGEEKRLFASPDEIYAIVLRPDGKELAFSMNEGGRHAIRILSTDGREQIKLCSACGDPTGWSPSMEEILVRNGSPSRIEQRRQSGGEARILLQQADYELGEAQFSPDGSWIAFRAGLGGDRLKLYVAPYRTDGSIPPQDWIPITDGKYWDDKPRWSTDGGGLYFESTRDNFMCLWIQRLDPHSRSPQGPPSPFIDLHSKEFSLEPVSSETFNLSIGGGYLFFNAAEMRANVWIGSLGSTGTLHQ
jgi:serine/threonine protein kinase